MEFLAKAERKRSVLTPEMWLLLIGCLFLILFATSCGEVTIVASSKPTDEEQAKEPQENQPKRGNGNGTGYGGKPTYYSIDPNELCVRNNGIETNVNGIIVLGDNNAITYFEGCELENGQPVPSQDVTFSAHNEKILFYKNKNLIFEKREVYPESLDGLKQVVAACDFTPLPVVLSGTNSYLSRIHVVIHRWNEADPYYKLSIDYEQVDLNSLNMPINVSQLSETGTAVDRDFENSGRTKEYDELAGPHRELRSTINPPFPLEIGRFEWDVLGRHRTFEGGTCFHEVIND